MGQTEVMNFTLLWGYREGSTHGKLPPRVGTVILGPRNDSFVKIIFRFFSQELFEVNLAPSKIS